jgi:quercetin dioxygenase-like cupin family protein
MISVCGRGAHTVWRKSHAVVSGAQGRVHASSQAKHPHEKAGMLLKGKVELTIGEETRLYKSGEMFIIPPNTPHGAKPVDGSAIVLDVFSPVREDYAARFNQYISGISLR